ncbi:MAG: hypothetical protein V7700_00495 [Halioglobus sp.]
MIKYYRRLAEIHKFLSCSNIHRFSVYPYSDGIEDIRNGDISK